MLELGPIIKSLLRKPTAPVLIILQLALSVAIISNATSYVYQRYAYIARDPGFEVDGAFKFWVKQDSSKGSLDETISNDLNYLMSKTSVKFATAMTGVPLSSAGGTTGLSTQSQNGGEPSGNAISSAASIMRLTQHGLNTLGAKLIQGRDFYADEYLRYSRSDIPSTGSVIITKALAERLFPGEPTVLGKTVYERPGTAFTVVGVIENMFGHFLEWEFPQHVIIFPQLEVSDSVFYLVRVYGSDVNKRDTLQIMNELVSDLRNTNSGRVVGREETMETVVRNAYSGDHAMIMLLTTVLVMVIAVNALGMFGLTSFWVSQRRKQIGIRRALGATRPAILRYFVVENSVLVITALTLGAAAALAASAYMVISYSVEPLPWLYIPLTGLALLLITLSAAVVPVTKASYISPVEALTG
jgi:putative ABC transport system permease protein